MVSYFLLITADSEDPNGFRVSARKLINWRLHNNKWPLYAKTKNRHDISCGDQVLFYQGGKSEGRQHIIAAATVSGKRKAYAREEIDPDFALSTPPSAVLNFEGVKVFDSPIAIRPFIGVSDLFPRIERFWGSRLMGGCVRITANDFRALSFSENEIQSPTMK